MASSGITIPSSFHCKTQNCFSEGTAIQERRTVPKQAAYFCNQLHTTQPIHHLKCTLKSGDSRLILQRQKKTPPSRLYNPSNAIKQQIVFTDPILTLVSPDLWPQLFGSTVETQNPLHSFLFVSKKMHSGFTILALILSIVLAEKYAMVFGTADGWGNYSISSVMPWQNR